MQQPRGIARPRRHPGRRRRQPRPGRASWRFRDLLRDAGAHSRPRARRRRVREPRSTARGVTATGAGAVSPGIAQLARDHPEWSPWLALVGGALERADDSAWGGIRIERVASSRAATAPLLAGATISVDGGALDGWVAHLLALAG